ncbi:MAG: CRP-like cAMP-binding protein [Patiriisocius sp.]|jgi:CRP-like cAMP-binding protein
MNDKLIAVLERYGSFSPTEKVLIKDRLNIVVLKPGEIFIKKDIVVDKIGFLVSGILRNYSVNSCGKEITVNFSSENEFITVINSFCYGRLTTGAVHAETKCTLLYLDRDDCDFLKENIEDWLNAMVLLAGEYLLEINIFMRVLINEDAKNSYLIFLENYPEVAKKVSLGHIASFLGITQSTLSRIRKQLVS